LFPGRGNIYLSTDGEINAAIANDKNGASRLIVNFCAKEMVVLPGTVHTLPAVPIGASVFLTQQNEPKGESQVESEPA
jgi:hypothetical protein